MSGQLQVLGSWPSTDILAPFPVVLLRVKSQQNATSSHAAAGLHYEFKHPEEPQDAGTGGTSVSEHGVGNSGTSLCA